MTSFMGPMAPPPAAPPQPQAMDFQTDPTNRQRFRQFLNNRMQPPQPSMMQAPMMQPPAHMPPILPEVDIFNPQGYAAGGLVGGLENLGTMSKKMIDNLNNVVYGGDSGASVNYSDSGMSSAPQNALGGGLFQFDQPMLDQNIHSALTAQYGPLPPGVPDMSQMQQLGGSNANNQNLMLSQGVLGNPDATPLGQGTNMRSIFGFEDGGSVPPRRTDIRGQDHMLSYITPDEADILQALGGSGEAGPMGIPAYAEDDGDPDSNTGGTGGADSDDVGGGFGGGDGSDDSDNAADDDMGDVGVMDGPSSPSNDDDLSDSTEVAQDQQDMGFDVFDTVDAFNAVNLSKSGTLGQNYDINAINRGLQERDVLAETLANTVENEVETGKAPGSEVSGIASVESEVDNRSTRGPDSGKAAGLLGLDSDLLSSNVANPNAPGQLSSEQISALDALADKGFEDETAAMGLRGPDATDANAGIGYNPDTDMPYGLETVTDPQSGAQITTNLGGLTEQQIADQSFAMDIAGLMGSKPYGYEINPVTGKVVGQVGTPGFGYLGNAISFVQDMFTEEPENLEDLLARGAYSGPSGIDPATGGGGDGSVDKKSVLDPCPPGFSLVNGVCTPVSDAGSSGPVADPAADPAASIAPLPVIVPSNRQVMPFAGTMPSGYGTAVTGGVNPLVMSEMQKYAQLLSRPQPQYPVGLANGGPVSSNLDMAADNFLKALMPAA